MNRRITLGLVVAFSTLMASCGGPHPITIAITTAPPSSIEINGTAQIAATVTNDNSNMGVDWSCSPAATCGTLTPAHTASGANTTYQAPATAGSVTITAASTAKPTVTATANVTINAIGSASNLKGTYTFYANGWDSSKNPYSVAGAVVLDGSGNVTGGEQDFVDTSTPTVDQADPIPNTGGGSINLGTDGRGTLTITPTNLGGTETFSIVLVNNDHLLITEFDSFATSAGSMDLQTAASSVPMGGNAFALLDTYNAVALGGVITSNGTIDTAAEADADQAGSQSFDFTFSGDTINAPDASGRGIMTLDGFQFAYYVVGPEAFRLIELDGNTGGLYMAGSMYGQGTAAGAFSAASLKGSFAFGQYGEDASGMILYGAAGEFTTDASASLTAGVADFNQGDGHPVLAGSITGSAYTVASDGYGSITLASALDTTLQNFGVYLVDPALNITDPNNTKGGGGALMADLDTNSLGVGVVAPQTSGATFAGNYAFNQDGVYQSSTVSNGFFDIIGQVLSDGTSKLTGNADFNDLINTGQNANDTVTATFTPDPNNAGRATAQVSISGGGTTMNENLTIYQASNALLFHVDMDSPASLSGNTATGVLEKQQ